MVYGNAMRIGRNRMTSCESDKTPSIHADMTILDVVSRYRQTELVFKRYDEKAGACLCCQALFDPLRNVAKKYNLNLGQLVADLELAVKESKGPAD
jgi:hypothetical protein